MVLPLLLKNEHQNKLQTGFTFASALAKARNRVVSKSMILTDDCHRALMLWDNLSNSRTEALGLHWELHSMHKSYLPRQQSLAFEQLKEINLQLLIFRDFSPPCLAPSQTTFNTGQFACIMPLWFKFHVYYEYHITHFFIVGNILHINRRPHKACLQDMQKHST